MKLWKVRFRGTIREVVVEALTAKKAKELFAKMEGINSIHMVQASRANAWEAIKAS